MTPLKLIAASALTAAFVSCANQDQPDYDTSNPYGTPDYDVAESTPYQPVDPVNPVYDTPAAYEESTSPDRTASGVSAIPSRGGATTVHTIVRGDTLWGLGKQYNVSIEAIKQANSMTKDTVVLGQKIAIPAP